MRQPKLPVWLIAAIALSTVISLFSVYRRWQVETQNRAVSIAVEFDTVEGLTASQGITIDQGLVDLKAQGVNALVLSEGTIGELLAKGQATLQTSTWPVNQGSTTVMTPMSTLRFSDVTVMARAERGLRIRFQNLASRLKGRSVDTLDLPNVSPMVVRTTPIGLDPRQVEVAKKMGFNIVARCANPPGVSAKGVVQTLEWVHENGATVFLPEGDQVLGRRESLDTTIETLRNLKMLYATPEFAKIGGDINVVEKAPELVVRLHSAQAAELDKLTLGDAVERYSKAARERNMRMLMIRPFSFGAEQPNRSFASFIKKIDDQIIGQGLAMGTAKPYQEPAIPKVLHLLLGLALAPVIWYSIAVFVQDRRVRLAGAGLISLLALLAYVKSGQHAMAFLASMAFPFLGFVIADKISLPNLPKALQPLPAFLLICLFSLVGGLCVAGMLNGLPFYIKADEFKGIKISVFVPIIGVGVFYLSKIGNLKKIMSGPINWSSVILGFGILAMLGFMIARTGNDNGVGASDGEVAFRGVLDKILFVRPRTKEFLIGHPLLFLGIGLLTFIRSRQPVLESETGPSEDQSTPALAGWAALAMMVGSMGQTDIVNTLCHLHIPVMLSVARICLGVVIGSIIGLAVWIVALRFLPKAEA